jgi:hypothetical protein
MTFFLNSQEKLTIFNFLSPKNNIMKGLLEDKPTIIRIMARQAQAVREQPPLP